MDDYIGKGALYDALWDAKQEKKVKSLKDVFDFIDKFPVEDVVPVVRCKDCKWLHKPSQLCTNKRNRVFNTGIKRDFNCYCSYGERKYD